MQRTHPLPRGGTDLIGPIVVLRASTQTASAPSKLHHSLDWNACDILCAFANLTILHKRGLRAEVTLIEIQDRLKQQVRAVALELFGVELEQLNAETPPRPELGDLAFPVSFELAK